MRASDHLACQFDILLTTENLSDALMYGSYHSGIKATRTSQHNTVGKLSKDSVHSVSGAFVSYFSCILRRAQEEREYSQEVYKVSITGSQFARGRLPSQHPQGKKLKGE